MERRFIRIILVLAFMACASQGYAQFNLKKALGAAAKAGQAATLTDAQMAAYVKESVAWMDSNNTVLPADNPYVVRLNRLVAGINDADGIPLNFKVYDVVDVNAFACPDGSVRVFSALMDLMDDNELLGVIGHEIGHVLKRHSKSAFKTQLLTGAFKDVVSMTGEKAAALTESQLGTLGESMINAKYSQKQEFEADDCAYDFLVKNGKNPWGMVMSFEKLQSLEGGGAQKSAVFSRMFSSHPETQARIDKLTQRCNKDGYKRPVSE